MSGKSELLAAVKTESDEACKQCWDFFDEKMPGDFGATIIEWARGGDSLEEIYGIIMQFGEPKFVGMTDNGRKGLAMAIEHAVRQARLFRSS